MAHQDQDFIDSEFEKMIEPWIAARWSLVGSTPPLQRIPIGDGDLHEIERQLAP